MVSAIQSHSASGTRATQHQVPRASAGENHQVSKRRWKEVIQCVLACLVITAVADVALINFLFYPECNRETRDCFLVQHMWGQQ